MKSWLFLALAVILEIVWAIGMQYNRNWSHPGWSAVVIIVLLGSVYALSLAVQGIPLGTAYAIWTGLGTLGVAAWGVLVLGESASLVRALGIAFIIAGVLLLKLQADTA